MRLKFLAAFGVIAISTAAIAQEEKTFTDPRMDGHPVDRCLLAGKECDDPAAQTFCKTQTPPYLRANFFTFAPAKEPTLRLGEKTMCNGTCERMSLIVCTNEETDVEAS